MSEKSEFDRITETIRRRLGPAGDAVITEIKREHAGTTVYIPRQTSADREQRNLEIRRDSSSAPADRIASRHRLTPVHIRRISR